MDGNATYQELRIIPHLKFCCKILVANSAREIIRDLR